MVELSGVVVGAATDCCGRDGLLGAAPSIGFDLRPKREKCLTAGVVDGKPWRGVLRRPPVAVVRGVLDLLHQEGARHLFTSLRLLEKQLPTAALCSTRLRGKDPKSH
ncbi:hypothetical protein TNIN_302071 [Trichonephila inaurata madagascariensis]|uniref:Uncharacterized protein n=1 Tax=Trichonephila inaurata madagascariensis TaxID=2747483 RepID=A0A8X7CHH9_9ARAC|nr:hypothetical protein TNIN_302071 [Trichonephila inaurata madagascariensis]